jgi:uncharacterized lipoprotein YmbA
MQNLWLPIAALLSLAACASSPPADTLWNPPVIAVYEADPFAGKYEIVGRLWIDHWRSSLRVPAYSKREEAIVAMQNEAARLNADALVSVSCLDQRVSRSPQTVEPAFICYGVAVRLPRTQG